MKSFGVVRDNLVWNNKAWQTGGICLLLLSMLLVRLEAQQDPFKRGKKQDTVEQSSVPSDGTLKASNDSWRKSLQRRISMPPWFRDWQRDVQAQVSNTALKIEDSSWRESWYLYVVGLLLAVVFGFLHIAGPGHGKLFTISYFVSREASLKEGLWLSGLINLVDSLSAGFVVFLTYGLLSLTFSQSRWVEAAVSMLSYGIIVGWGLWHLLSHLFHGIKGCHHHGGNAEHRAGRPAWYFALGIGLVPCPISTALLIFGLLNQMLGVAIFLVVGVSLGGMLAMTLLSFAVIGGKMGVSSLLLSVLHVPNGKEAGCSGDKSSLFGFLREGVEILALVVMIVAGTLFLLLSFPF